MKKASQKKAGKKRVSRPVSNGVAHKSKAIKRPQASLKGGRSELKLRRSAKLKESKTSSARRAEIIRKKRSRRQVLAKTQKAQAKITTTSVVNPLKSASIKQYESAVKLLYAQDFEKAKAAFEKLIQTSMEDKEILERAKSHLKLCEQKIAPKPPAPRTMEDHYNLAIALMNDGKYEQSIEHLNKALRYNPNCDYVIYALAATNCRTGNLDGALNNLKAAIDLKPENRFLAQHDSDFEPLMQDTRFLSMVYPERITPPSR